MDKRTSREGFRGSLVSERVYLTLKQNTAGAAAATHWPPLLSPPRCTAAESRPLAERPPARLRHEEQGRDGGGGRMAGIPVFPGRPERGEEGTLVTWSRH